MIIVYHGSDEALSMLRKGSFVTRNIEDAWKFGYRKAVVNSKSVVYLSSAEIEESDLSKDPNRDKSYIIKKDLPLILIGMSNTYQSPFKLGKFRLKA